jgi:hypothetical protein
VAAPRSQRLATGAILVLAAGIAVAAVVSGLAGGRSPAPAPPPAASATTTARVPAGDIHDLPPPPPGALKGTFDLVDEDCAVRRYDLRTQEATDVVHGYCDAWFSPSGRYALVAPHMTAHASLSLLDMSSGAVVATGLVTGTDYEGPPAVADDGTALSCFNGVLSIRSPNGGQRAYPPLCPATPLGHRVVALALDQQSVIDAVTGATLYRIPHPRRHYDGYFAALVASPDGDQLAVVTFNAASGYAEVRRIDTRTGQVSPVVPAGIGTRYIRLGLSNDGRLLALETEGGWDVWNLDHGTNFHRVADRTVNDVGFSPDSRMIAVATDAGMAILDAATLAPRYLLPVPAHRVAWRA